MSENGFNEMKINENNFFIWKEMINVNTIKRE
jgi:hypothetical protein